MTNQIVLKGKRWNDTNGNTYHTVDIYINGDYAQTSPITYGYDFQYEVTAKNILKEQYDIIMDNCKVISICCDVKRKKDL